MRFALNHIAAPRLLLPDFFAAARELGLGEVEIRNDLPDVVSTWAPAEVKAEAEKAGVTILSINALYPFNVWTGDLPRRAGALAERELIGPGRREALRGIDESTLHRILDFATRAAAITVSRQGANPPRRDELPA